MEERLSVAAEDLLSGVVHEGPLMATTPFHITLPAWTGAILKLH